MDDRARERPAPHRQPLPHRGTDRYRRDGRRLAGHRRAAQPTGRGQGTAGPRAGHERVGRRGLAAASPAGGPHRRPPPARARHQHVRRRHPRRATVAGDGVPAVRLAGHRRPPQGSAGAGAGRGDRARRGRRTVRGAPRGRRAPRRQAGQRADRHGRAGQAHRLRGVPRGRRRAAHPHGPDRGHARVPRARDRPGPHPDVRFRRLRTGRDALRGGGGRPALRARRQRVRAAAQGRDRAPGAAATRGPAHRSADAPARRRSGRAPVGRASP